ncbi:MAG: histidine kinase [Bacteroidia bacterium]|nr:histidine kinase [Bacteroidia bacterium]
MTSTHILYVDDETSNLSAFKAAFRRDFQVITASSGAEGLRLLATSPVAVVVTDQRMPEMTGVEFLEQLQAAYPDTIRIVMTGYADIQAIIDAINKGHIYYYIAKPWKYESLRPVLANALDTYRLKTENRSLHEANAQLQLDTALLERARVQAQYESLKNQVNPHFLFNSLNVLSSLVHEDPDLAETFISRLTRVYRYVLEVHHLDLVSLDTELQCMTHYLFLHQVRFGNNLQVYTEIDPALRNWQVPPLSLQLLAENALKHNIVSRGQPLTLEVVTTDQTLLIRNTWQPRETQAPSTGMGLNNLRERYQFFSQTPVTAGRENNYFCVRIPLIPPTVS